MKQQDVIKRLESIIKYDRGYIASHKGTQDEIRKLISDLKKEKGKKMSEEEHKERHKILHKELDELLADFISVTKKMPSQTKIIELMEWSHKQTIKPEKAK